MSRRLAASAFVALLCLAGLASVAPVATAEPAEVVSTAGWLPEQRIHHSAVADDGKIYVFGGFVNDLYGSFEQSLDTVLIYDISTGVTSYGAAMPTGVVGALTSNGFDGRMYLLGGYNTSVGYIASVQIYDPVSDSWTTGANAPASLGLGQAVTGNDGRIYTFGSAIWWMMNSTLIYDPVADSWEFGADQSGPIGIRSAAVVNDTAIVVMGGYDNLLGWSTDAVGIYNPVDDTWTPAAPLLRDACFAGGAISGDGKVYFIGGAEGSWVDGTQIAMIQRYDPAIDEWAVASSSLPWARAGVAAVTDDYGRIFVVGGYDGGSTLDDVVMMLSTDLEYDSLVIASPSDGAVVSGEVAVVVSIANMATFPALVDLLVDGARYDSQVPGWWSGSWTFMWDTSGLPDGSSHTIMVRMFLSDGSVKEASVTVTVVAMSLEERIAGLEADLAALADSLGSLNLTVEDLRTQIGVVQADIAALQTDLDSLGADVTALQAQLTGLGTALAQLGAGLTAMGASQTAAMDALNVTLVDLQVQLDAFQEQIDRVENKADTAGTYGMITLVLVIVVIVLLALMFVMARKKP